MSAEPLVSVIIPIYNAEAYVKKAIESVRNQSYRNLEIILVDDGSTDASAAICDEAARADARVRVIHKPNGGVASARNAGLDAATGDYINWLDSDDIYDVTAIEKLLNAVRTSGKRIAICNYTNVRPDGSRQPRYKINYGVKTYERDAIMGLNLGILLPSASCCNLVPRALYEGIRYPDGRIFEDVRTTHKVYERGDGAVVLSESLMERIVHADSISALPNIANRADGCLAYIERYEAMKDRWPQYRRAMLVSSARQLRTLRTHVLANPPENFERNRDAVSRVCAFFRAHRDEILPKDAGPLFRLEYRFITEGTRRGFLLSSAVDRLAGKPESYIWGMKIPDMPEY